MIINVKVHPNSKKDEVIQGNPLVVRVTDPPEKGKANKKIINLLSNHFNAKVRIVGGLKVRNKVIEVSL